MSLFRPVCGTDVAEVLIVKRSIDIWPEQLRPGFLKIVLAIDGIRGIVELVLECQSDIGSNDVDLRERKSELPEEKSHTYKVSTFIEWYHLCCYFALELLESVHCPGGITHADWK